MIGLQLQRPPHYLLPSFVHKPTWSWLYTRRVIVVCQRPIIMSQHLKSLSLYFYSFREFLLSAQFRVSLLRLYIWLPLRCQSFYLFVFCLCSKVLRYWKKNWSTISRHFCLHCRAIKLLSLCIWFFNLLLNSVNMYLYMLSESCFQRWPHPSMSHASNIYILSYHPPLESGLGLWLTFDERSQVEVMLGDL